MLLSGKPLAKDIRDVVHAKVSAYKQPLKLAILLVGENPASQLYVSNKQEACKKVGIECEIHRLPADIKAIDLVDEIQRLNNDRHVTGILLQSPVSEHLHFQELANLIHPHKDVDGLSIYNTGLLAQGDKGGIAPATPKGIMRLLKYYDVDIASKHATVIGRSPIVGRPMGLMLMHAGATVTWCHSQTPDIAVATKDADIIISAVGQKNLITADMVKPGATIIDVGINRDGVEGIVGDADLPALEELCDITPVPGGVGPLTIACLLDNITRAYELQNS